MNSVRINYFNCAHFLAQKKFGKTFPNPSVGCVIVNNKGKIIAKAATGLNGQPHAEELAIKKAGEKAFGSTMYVTLEPCYHKRKNGSCAEQIIKAGIKRIFIASFDPNPKTKGKSIKLFKKKGIVTNVGLTSELSKTLNRFFFKSIKFKRPYVKVKIAISQDSKFTKKGYSSKWISNTYSRKYSHYLRSQSQVILTTAKTVIKDNPRLTIRQKNKKTKLISVVIIDKDLKTPLNTKLIKSAKLRKVIIFTSKKNDKYNKLIKLGCIIILQKLDSNHKLNLKNIMKKIFSLNINNIFVESGGILLTNLIKSKLIDELHLFTAPFTIGKKGKSLEKNFLLSKFKFIENKRKYFGKDLYQKFYVNY